MNSSRLPPGQKEVRLQNESFVIDSPVDLDLVKVEYAPGDTLVLASGARGRIGRIEIDTRTEDGIKVQNADQNAARDFTIEEGYVTAHGMKAGAHQDGVQVMGGRNLSFENIDFKNFGTQGIFVNKAGSGATTPTDISFLNCRILDSDDGVTDGPASPVNINGSVRTTLKNCHVVKSKRYGRGIIIGSGAVDEVVQGNTEYPVGTQLPDQPEPPDPPDPPDPEPEPEPTTAELIEASYNLINASQVAKKWQADNPGEWEKVEAYWSNANERPESGVNTSFGKGLIALTDAYYSL